MIKVPPNAPEAEKAVLGAIMLEKEAFSMVSDVLTREMFYVEKNGSIWAVIESLKSKGSAVDVITVCSEIKADREMSAYVVSLTNSVVSSAHIVHHARKIVETYLQREVIRIGGVMYADGFKGSDPFEMIEQASKSLHQLTMNLNSKDVVRLDETMIGIIRDLEQKRHRETYFTGIPTGYKELNAATCGWQPTDLIILAARPKCGKTAFALNLAKNASDKGCKVLFFSMEMSARQLGLRILANQSGIFLQHLRDARMDDEQMQHLFTHGVQKLANHEIYFDDTAAMTVQDIKTKARRMINKIPGEWLVIVDYLQLIKGERGKKNQNREQEVSNNARELKIMAKELNVPVISLSQLSREVEKRAGGVPQLSDLRESGAIEQDADMVNFLYRPSEAEIMSDATKAGTVFFKIAAFRNGELRTIEFDFDGGYQRFSEKGFITHGLPQGNWHQVEKEEDSFPGF